MDKKEPVADTFENGEYLLLNFEANDVSKNVKTMMLRCMIAIVLNRNDAQTGLEII